jgi:gliding motility-associated-like protein
MNRLFTFLLTGMLVLTATLGIAQAPTFTITPQTQSVTAGSTVTFSVNVSNFTNIEGLQFSMFWDPTKLTYVDVIDLTLPGLTTGNFGLNGNSKLSVSWISPSLAQGTTVANGSIYKVNFTAITSGTVSFNFGNSPAAPEIIGAGGADITGSTTFNPAVTSGGGGGTGGNTCAAPSGISAVPANTSANVSWAAATGANSYVVQYKATSATTWTSATTSTTNFTIPNLTVCTDYEVQVQSVCTSGSSPFSASTNFKTTGCSTGGGGTGGTAPCWTCAQVNNNLLGFGLIFSEEYVETSGNDVTVKLHVNSFTKVEGMQFEIKWDPSQLQYKSNNPILAGLNAGSLSVNAAAGKMGLQWLSPTSDGTTLSDCSVILELQFKTLGAANSTSSVSINTASTATPELEIIANGSDVTKNIPASNFIAGKVIMKKCVGGPVVSADCNPVYDKTFNVSVETSPSLGQVCNKIIVNDFTNIEGFQFTLRWDPSKLTFLTVKKAGLTDLIPAQYNIDPSQGFMTIAYSPSASPSVTLPNGATAFEVCFTVAANNGSSADIQFSNNPLKFETYVGSALMTSATTKNGKVIVAEPPVVTIKEEAPSCAGAKTGILKAEVPAGNFDFLWTGPTGFAGGTTQTISNLNAGGYKVVATDKATCLQNTALITLSNKAGPKVTKLEQTSTGFIVEGTNTAEYKWINVNAPLIILSTTKELNGITQPGKYKATLTSSLGCMTDTVATFIRAIPDVTSAKCGGDGKITIDVGVAANLKYTWSPNVSTTNTATNLAVGDYFVTIEETSSKANVKLGPLKVAGPQLLTINPTVTVTAPPNTCATISATGGTGTLSYAWSSGNSTTPTACNLVINKKYTVTVTDQNSCTATKDITPTCAQGLFLANQNVTTKATTCGDNNGAITIKPGGGSGFYGITWSNGLSNDSTTVKSLKAGNYSVTVYDIYCFSQIKLDDIKVESSTKPIISLDKVVDAKDDCSGSIALLVKDGVAPYTYQWSSNAKGQTVKDPTKLCEGIYSVTLTDQQPCVVVSIDITVTGLSVPQEDITTTVKKSKCPNSNDGAINLVIKGGKAPLDYFWKYNGTAYPIKSNTLTNLLPGVYEVVVTDAAGKVFTKSYTVESESGLDYTVKVTDPTPNTAKNGAASVQIILGVAPYTYLWSTGATTPQINNLGTGAYAITITDSNGCKVSKSFPVGDVGSVEIIARTNFNGVNIRCNGMCNGIAEVKSVGDAVPPLKYKWSSGDTTSIAKGLCAGVYKVVVTDANNEKFEGSVTITAPEKLEITITITDATNGKDGKAAAKVFGGTSPFIYRWSNNAATDIITNQEPGRVFLMIEDANGCTAFRDGIIGPRGGDVSCLSSIPVITPNSDGFNDFLDIYCLEDYKTNQLDVYNRFGQQVFSKTNYVNRTWQPLDDSGNPMPEGGYFYILDVEKADGTRPPKFKGAFNVLNK